jgi:hypothetical protein
VSSDIVAEVHTPASPSDKVTVEDFVAYLPAHNYIFIPCRETWIRSGVDARVPSLPVLKKNGQPKISNGRPMMIKATRWIDQNRPIDQLTWCPGKPLLIPGRLVVNGGWIERKGVTTFNLYRPPRIALGDATQAMKWIDHAHRIYPTEADYIIRWLAHRVQRPQEKINHALVLGGQQGIGKDTMLEPVKHAVGPWNFAEVSPTHLLGRFNGYVKSVILRVSEGRDLGEIDRFKFYDHTKIYTAAPPDVLRVDEKHLREHNVFNVLGFILTTNHKTDGVYLPADDRRHYVAWSDCTKERFKSDYWNGIWSWYADGGGFGHVAAYLRALDISKFDPKAPPPKTPAFWDIVAANNAPEDAELADVIDALGNPKAVTLAQLIANATGGIAEWLTDRRNRRAIPHRMERCRYVSVRNEAADDGLWVINNRRQSIYARTSLSLHERIAAAQALVEDLRTARQ